MDYAHSINLVLTAMDFIPLLQQIQCIKLFSQTLKCYLFVLSFLTLYQHNYGHIDDYQLTTSGRGPQTYFSKTSVISGPYLGNVQ